MHDFISVFNCKNANKKFENRSSTTVAVLPADHRPAGRVCPLVCMAMGQRVSVADRYACACGQATGSRRPFAIPNGCTPSNF